MLQLHLKLVVSQLGKLLAAFFFLDLEFCLLLTQLALLFAPFTAQLAVGTSAKILVGIVNRHYKQHEIHCICPPRLIPRRQNPDCKRRFLLLAGDEVVGTHAEGVGAFAELRVFLCAGGLRCTPLLVESFEEAGVFHIVLATVIGKHKLYHERIELMRNIEACHRIGLRRIEHRVGGESAHHRADNKFFGAILAVKRIAHHIEAFFAVEDGLFAVDDADVAEFVLQRVDKTAHRHAVGVKSAIGQQFGIKEHGLVIAPQVALRQLFHFYCRSRRIEYGCDAIIFCQPTSTRNVAVEAIDRRHIHLAVDFANEVVAAARQAMSGIEEIDIGKMPQIGRKSESINAFLPMIHPQCPVGILFKEVRRHIESFDTPAKFHSSRGAAQHLEALIVAHKNLVGVSG